MKTFLVALAVVLVVGVFLVRRTSGFVVKTGNVGLVINHYSGKINPNVRTAGFNAQPRSAAMNWSRCRPYQRTYTMVRDSTEGGHAGDDSVLVNTLSSNTLKVDVSVTYHIAWDPQHPERIVALYKKYRSQFRDFASFEEVQLRPGVPAGDRERLRVGDDLAEHDRRRQTRRGRVRPEAAQRALQPRTRSRWTRCASGRSTRTPPRSPRCARGCRPSRT
jgi:hypothetical protein